MEYHEKYEVEQKGYQRFFKPYRPEANYWLRIFSNEDLYISELKKPYEISVGGTWTKEVNSGGPRFIVNKSKTKYVENPYWPINPQYLVKFNQNVKAKFI